MRKGKSRFKIFLSATETFFIIEQAPMTTKRLKKLAPRILFIANSVFLSRLAMILMEASGKQVPMVTTVSPTITLGILKKFAIKKLPEIKISAPLINPASPMMSKK
jgi:hypothetical protein